VISSSKALSVASCSRMSVPPPYLSPMGSPDGYDRRKLVVNHSAISATGNSCFDKRN
jgi:hypothetical protein